MSLTKVSYSMVAGAPLNILDFGAVPGADNTAAIIAAIAATTDGVGTKIILCNSLISGTVTVNKSDIIFDSNGATIAYTSGFSGNAYDNMFYVTSPRVTFQNMTVNQGLFTPAAGTQRTIWFAYGVDVGAVLNCKFNSNLYICVAAVSGSSRIQIKGNTFINCRAAVVTSGDACITESNIVGNDIAPGGADSVFSINGGTGSSCINNIIFNSAFSIVGGDIIDVVDCQDVSITGNHIYGLKGGNGINLYKVATGVTSGIVANNIIDGAGLTATTGWVLISVLDSTYIQVKNNILKNPPTVVGTCFGINVQTGYNIVSGNDIFLGAASVEAGITIYGDTGPLDIVDNRIYCLNRGINFRTTTNNNMTPIIIRGNQYGGSMIFAYDSSTSSLLPNAPIWLENEKYLSTSIIYWNIAKYNTLLSYYSSAQLPFSLKNNCVLYSATTPVVGTWQVGDNISQAVPTVGQPKGWMCTVAGTYSAATEAGTATIGSPIITGMADTSDFFVGDYVDSTAQFAVLTRLTILSKTASSITVNRNANGNGACTLSTTDPTWVSTGNL